MRLNAKDVSKLLSVSEKTVYRWAAQGKIPCYRINDRVRFARPEVMEWATANHMPVSPAFCLEADENSGELPSLCAALERGGIFYRVEGNDRDSALAALAGVLRLPAAVDRAMLLEMLRVREEMGSTAVGEGIAIPHPRSPLVLEIEEPSLTLCFLDEAIDFAALDGKPVSVFFTILSPSVRAHLHLLSSLAFALHDEGLCEAIRARVGRPELMRALQRVESGFAANQVAPMESRRA